MRRAVLRSSHMVASASKNSPRKPWHIIQCHTWHASQTSCQSHNHTSPISKSPWSLPLQQKLSGTLEECHLHLNNKLSPQFTPSFLGSFYTPSLSDPNIGLNTPILEAHNYDNKHNRMEVRKSTRILQLAHLHALKDRLQKNHTEVMAYDDLLKMCVSMGFASSLKGAVQLVKCLDNASLILIVQEIVYLNPTKVVKFVNTVLPRPSSTAKEGEGILQEIFSLKEEKKGIEKLAYKYSRTILWLGFGYLTLQMLLIFRLTFWDLSWDIMEPIAYFVTNITLLLGYAFFMLTSKHPTYKNLGATLLSSKQRKLMKRRNFDMARLLELQRQCDYVSTPSRSTIAPRSI